VITYDWRGPLADDELCDLVASHGGTPEPGWWDRIRPHVLGWVVARDGGRLVGFVDVAWDGGDHAFLLDTKVRGDRQRRGIGTALVREAVEHARAAGCEWLHVDFRPELAPFYRDACGFRPTDAGLIRLRGEVPDVAPPAAPVLHLSIPVHDLDAARAFYVDVLGCEPGRVRDDWIDVWFFGLQLTLQRRPDEVRPAGEQGVRHLGAVLPDAAAFDAIVRRLEAADVEWLARPIAHADEALSGKVGLKVADPSGNVVELKRYPDPQALRRP